MNKTSKILFPNRPGPAIHWHGQPLSVAEACAAAAQAHHAGNFQAMADIYALILQQVPDQAEIHNNLGVVLQKLQRYEAALASYDQAIARKPDYANAHYNRGTILKILRRLDEALAGYDRVLALKPDHLEALNNRGVLLQELRRHDEARACYDRVLALQPGHAEALNNRGILLAGQGDMAGAEKMFRQAAALKPEFIDPWYNLVHLHSYPHPDAPEVAHIRNLLNRPRLSPAEREHLGFTLGKIYDDADQYEQAFKYYRQANQIRNAQAGYDAGRVAAATAATIQAFPAAGQNAPAAAPNRPGPLFIVGMPRSGTTLLASILSNHPAIATAGELSTIGDFTSRWPALTGGVYPLAAANLSAAAASQLAGEYELRLRDGAAPSAAYVIDKNPLNFWHIGFIARLFPQARMIHCTRHPLATCLSNYFQRFPLRLDYAFDLRNIGHFYGQYLRLMAHWRTVPALPLMEVSYEDMILNTEPVARQILDFLGLAWDARCLAPHTNPCRVETASQWQVRQPIYRASLDKWRHYEKHLGPVKSMLPGDSGGHLGTRPF